MIEQEPFCGVRTHFYHDASSYDMFRDRRVVEWDFVRKQPAAQIVFQRFQPQKSKFSKLGVAFVGVF